MAVCCPKTFTGFCLEDNTPIAITIDNGVLISWTNLVTGTVTPGNPPAGTGVCEVPSTITVEVEIPPVTFDPLTCVKDAVTVCQGTTPWEVTGNIVVEPTNLDCLTDSVTVCQGTDPWTIDGTVALDAPTLAALETITVNQGTSPWVVSGTVSVTEPVTVDAIDFDIRNLDCLTDSVTICPGDDPIPVSFDGTISVSLDCATDSVTICPGDDPIAVIGTVTVNQGTSPWVVSATDFDIRNLDCATDSVTVCPGVDPLIVDVIGLVDVAVSGIIDTRFLDCATDSIEVCQGTSPWVVDDPDIPDLTGTWAYQAGVSGVEVIGAGQRVIGIAAHAGITAGSMTINGGDVIPVPANTSITINPYGQLIAPTVVFTGTDSYFIETLI